MDDLGRHQKLFFAEQFEYAGQFGLAERLILEVLEELDTEKDRASVGALHINLGSCAGQAGRVRDSTKYLTRAIDLLEGLEGDPILQCAHAHFNLATVLLDERNEGAVEHSERALELYKMFPFTEKPDLVDARIAVLISRAMFGKSFDLEEALQLWRDMKKMPFESLTKANVLTFVVMCTSLRPSRGLKSMVSPFEGMLNECRHWAGKEFTNRVKQHLKEAGL